MTLQRCAKRVLWIRNQTVVRDVVGTDLTLYTVAFTIFIFISSGKKNEKKNKITTYIFFVFLFVYVIIMVIRVSYNILSVLFLLSVRAARIVHYFPATAVFMWLISATLKTNKRIIQLSGVCSRKLYDTPGGIHGKPFSTKHIAVHSHPPSERGERCTFIIIPHSHGVFRLRIIKLTSGKRVTFETHWFHRNNNNHNNGWLLFI